MTARVATLPAELAGCRPVAFEVDTDALVALAEADRQALAPRGGKTRGCVRKRAYGRRAAARAARRLRDAQGEDVHAYHCEHCQRHHVGHRPVAG